VTVQLMLIYIKSGTSKKPLIVCLDKITKGYPLSCATNYLPWNSVDLHAHPWVVYYNCEKFHQYLFICLGEVLVLYLQEILTEW